MQTDNITPEMAIAAQAIGKQLREAVAALDAEMPEAAEGWAAMRRADAIVRDLTTFPS